VLALGALSTLEDDLQLLSEGRLEDLTPVNLRR